MKAIKVLLTFGLLCLVLAAQSQASFEKAQQILGDHFIGSNKALAAWQKLDPNLKVREDVYIPYGQGILEFFQAKNIKGEGNFFLVPTLGLRDSTLKKFWFNYHSGYGFPEKTEVEYRLVNLAPPGDSSFSSFNEASSQMLADDGSIMPAMDFMEVVATIYMVTGKNVSPHFNYLLLSGENVSPSDLGGLMRDFKGKLVTAYSANIGGGCQEIITSFFPRENFYPAKIGDSDMTLLATETDNSESIIVIPFRKISCFSGRRKDYFVGVCYFVNK